MGHSHGHGHPHSHDIDDKLKQRLKYAAALTAVIFLVELVGGYMTNSLALMADALHMLMDLVALCLSLFALHISSLPPNEKKTYGYHRAEVFAAFINSASLMVISVFIFYKAYGRLFDPPEVESTGMLIVAVIGLCVNLLVAVWLMSYASRDLNIKSAFLHVIGDAAASVGVIVAAIVIARTGFNMIDPMISFAIGAVILMGSWRIVRESSHILLEGVPKDIDFAQVVEDLKAVEGVDGVHSMHIWSICHNIYALSAHVDATGVGPAVKGRLVNEINDKLAQKYHIFYTTLQVECPGCDEIGALRKIVHR